MMTNEQWKQFNLKLLAAVVGMMIGMSLTMAVMHDVMAKHNGVTCQVVCEAKGEKR